MSMGIHLSAPFVIKREIANWGTQADHKDPNDETNVVRSIVVQFCCRIVNHIGSNANNEKEDCASNDEKFAKHLATKSEVGRDSCG